MKKNILFCGLLLLVSIHGFTQSNKFITVSGKQLRTPDGKPFLMQGTNLGNWLVPEGYMFRFEKTNSPRMIQQLINELVGPDESKKFWQQYLTNYVQQPDIRYLRSIGMNSIRIPFHYKLFTDEEYLGGRGEKRGFALMDKVIQWCKQEGLYVLLDMHCAPGGQTGDNIDDGVVRILEEVFGKKMVFDAIHRSSRHGGMLDPLFSAAIGAAQCSLEWLKDWNFT